MFWVRFKDSSTWCQPGGLTQTGIGGHFRKQKIKPLSLRAPLIKSFLADSILLSVIFMLTIKNDRAGQRHIAHGQGYCYRYKLIAPTRTVGNLRSRKVKTIIAIAVLFMSSLAMAHSGGTDKDGCHVDSKTGYKHCH